MAVAFKIPICAKTLNQYLNNCNLGFVFMSQDANSPNFTAGAAAKWNFIPGQTFWNLFHKLWIFWVFI